MKEMLVHAYVPAEPRMESTDRSHFKRKKFVLTGCGMPEIFTPTEDTPELELVEWYGFYRAVPTTRPLTPYAGPMFGGAFVYTSDSRFNHITGGHPVPLHDRYEFSTPAFD